MNSLRRQLTGRLLGLCALLWVTAGGGLYAILRIALVAEFDATLQARAQALATLTKQGPGKMEFEFAGEIMTGFERHHSADYFQVWQADGTTLERSPSLRATDLPLRAGTPAEPVLWNMLLPDGHAGRAIGLRFVPQLDDEVATAQPMRATAVQPVTLVVACNREALDQHLHVLLATLFLTGAALVLLTTLIVPAVVRRSLAPVDNLVQRVAAVDATALQVRFPSAGLPTELRPVAERLNELLARLEAAFARERRFSADVAHELRTPIAELRALAEVALQWPDDHAAGLNALREALAIAAQMEAIATRLMTLARCEAGTQPIRTGPVLVAVLIAETWKPLTEKAHRKQLTNTWDVPAAFSITADPALLRVILENLLENAVEYSPVGSHITIAATGGTAGWQLNISNPAGNLESADLLRLFERFWRKDQARASAMHCGLGLALAQACARVLQLELQAMLSSTAILTLSLHPQGNPGPKEEPQP